MSECGAKKKDGTPCRQNAMANGRCRLHGGSTPSGLAASQFRTGRYSKHLPARLANSYQEAISDPELLSVREDVALLDSRLQDVLSSASNGEAGELWKSLKEALREHDRAKPDERAEAFGKIRWLINEGYQEWQSWMEIRHILQERKQLVEREEKRLVAMQQMITAERAMLLVAAIEDIVIKHVEDSDARNRIATAIEQLISK